MTERISFRHRGDWVVADVLGRWVDDSDGTTWERLAVSAPCSTAPNYFRPGEEIVREVNQEFEGVRRFV